MPLPTYWLSFALAIACLASLATVWWTWRLPAFPGQRSFALAIGATAWWSGVVALEHASQQPETKVFLAGMAWLGIVLSPGGWVLFIWNYLHGQHRPVPRPLYAVLIAIAVTVWLLAITNPHHHLMYVATVPTGMPPAMTVNYFHGPLYFVIAAVFYFAMAASEALLIYQIVHASPLYRTHYVGLAVAVTVPSLVNLGYATKTVMIGTADPTPLSFVVMNTLLYWLIARRQLFDLLPIAQSSLLDALPDPVLVLDGIDRITECNPAAQRLFADQRLHGLPIALVPALRPCLASNAEPPGAAPRELSIGARHFDVGDVALTFAGRAVGRLVLLREITHRKQAELRLHAAHAELEQQLAANVALQKRLREESIRDALTGLHNRRFFEELGPVMLAEAKRAGAPLAAAMIDVDHFKRLNDTHGHAAGDAVLRAVGDFLRRSVRQTDRVFRMGGEEFLILLPHTSAEAALTRVDAWRAAFADEITHHDGTALRATYSVGLALFPQDADDVAGLLARADRALYDAKAGGRNRTVRWRATAVPIDAAAVTPPAPRDPGADPARPS